ncbi:HNH endonuclease [Rhodococcus wratislaviensis]|uniref:HNH endonuclease n=1 Tax=Rhodococcus wratislaviensis TaxID=44752 RepID=UPI001C3F3538|nr:HNH endonuclease signature motif containing protein [Rhodococcus wratislaviensis]
MTPSTTPTGPSHDSPGHTGSHTPPGVGPSTALPDLLHEIAEALIEARVADARRAMDSIAFERRGSTRRRAPREKDLAAIYDRDRYLCRYCGVKTILTPVMRLLSANFPAQFPFHPNWKTTDTHPAYWSLSATHDHVVPLSHGGDPLDAGNIVTACWPCNSRKSGLLLDDVGFVLRGREESRWRGLADLYPSLWVSTDTTKSGPTDIRSPDLWTSKFRM